MFGLLLVVRGFAVVGGAIVCYGALFLYEREQALVQNTLEAWWIRIDDLQKAALSFQAAFAKAVSEATDRLASRLFGTKLLSVRACAVSLLLSFVSTQVVGIMVLRMVNAVLGADHDIPSASVIYSEPMPLAAWHGAEAMAELLLWDRSVTLRVITLGALAVVILAGVSRRLNLLLVLSSAAVILFFVYELRHEIIRDIALMFLAMLAVGIACDLATITMIRALIRWQAAGWLAVRIYGAAVVELLLGLGLIALPVVIGNTVRNAMNQQLGNALIFVPATNLPAILLCVSFVLVAAMFLVHRLAWPSIARPLYQLARIGVFRSAGTRTTLLAVGSAAVTVGLTGEPASLWRGLLRLFGSA